MACFKLWKTTQAIFGWAVIGGIYRVNRQELNDFAEARARSINSIVYGTKDGLATLECNGGRQPSGLKTKDGKLWFPTMSGVAVFDPKVIQAKPEPPVIRIKIWNKTTGTIIFDSQMGRATQSIPPHLSEREAVSSSQK